MEHFQETYTKEESTKGLYPIASINTMELNPFFTLLYEENSKLREENQILREENRILKETVKTLTEKVEGLTQEIQILKGRLNLNSHNSSKPPSSDGLRKKPAFPRNGTGKKGGQKNHKGNTLKQVTTPDFIEKIKPEHCECCGYNLQNEQGKIIDKRQVFDIPQPKLYITEYQLYKTICPNCKAIHTGDFPQGVNAPSQYGNGVKAYLTLLNNHYKLAHNKVKGIFYDLYGYPVNESTVITTNQTFYQRLQPCEEIIKTEITKSTVANADESGIRVEGKLYWLHVTSTALFSYFYVHKKRGEQAMNSPQSILNRFFGWLVHDCWSSYFNFTHIKHAICNAHILRELEALIENNSKWAKVFKTFLLKVYYMTEDERLRQKHLIESRYSLICGIADKREPFPQKKSGRGKCKRTKGRNLLERLVKRKEAVLAFAFNKEVPFTNNLAERDIRPAKTKQKISGSFRTFQGAEVYARIEGFISTCKKHHQNIFKELVNTLNGSNFILDNYSCAK